MTPDIAQIAFRQLRDYDARTPGTIFAEGLAISVAEAYAIQKEVCRLRQQRGEAVIGYKLGCTSPVIREQLGIEHSVFGRLFATERYDSGATLARSQFDGLAIEGELAVRLADDVPADGADPDCLLESVESVFPVIELHHHVLRGPGPAVVELIANNAIHAGFVAAGEESLPPGDLAMRILLSGEVAAEVNYDCWQDRIARAVMDLISLLAPHGLSLQAGQVILTGSVAPLIPIRAATSVEVRTLQHGTVSATFTDSNHSAARGPASP